MASVAGAAGVGAADGQAAGVVDAGEVHEVFDAAVGLFLGVGDQGGHPDHGGVARPRARRRCTPYGSAWTSWRRMAEPRRLWGELPAPMAMR